MTDRSADLLIRVASFLRGLSGDQIDALAAGEARLGVIPKGARVIGGLPAGPVALPISPEQVNADLRALGDRHSAVRYLNDLKLKKTMLQELARQLDVPFKSDSTIGKIIDLIVEQKVGHRLGSDAIFARKL